jgi:signal transduction histidine kinase
MTVEVITCAVTEDIANVLALMSLHTIRHVPVVDADRIVGLLSVRDLLDFQQQMLIADIDRRKQDAAALREAHARLEKAFRRRTEEYRLAKDMAVQANSSKTVFLANMGHELRTPLNAIIGFSEVLSNEAFGPVGCPQYREYAADINEAGHLLLSLINDLLDIAKMESGKEELIEEQVEIERIAQSAMKLVSGQAAKSNISLSHEVEPGTPPLWADQRKLQQILTNLLSNAVKFTEEGGRISMKVWCRPESGYVFQVTDTGIGIAQNDIPKALSQFGQIDSALSRKFNGTVGVGTTVTLRLPASRIMTGKSEENVA